MSYTASNTGNILLCILALTSDHATKGELLRKRAAAPVPLMESELVEGSSWDSSIRRRTLQGLNVCGDRIINFGVEECDDGNTNNNDFCTNECKFARCGDGFVQSGEECDDGNNTNGDGCSASCRIEIFNTIRPPAFVENPPTIPEDEEETEQEVVVVPPEVPEDEEETEQEVVVVPPEVPEDEEETEQEVVVVPPEIPEDEEETEQEVVVVPPEVPEDEEEEVVVVQPEVPEDVEEIEPEVVVVQPEVPEDVEETELEDATPVPPSAIPPLAPNCPPGQTEIKLNLVTDAFSKVDNAMFLYANNFAQSFWSENFGELQPNSVVERSLCFDMKSSSSEGCLTFLYLDRSRNGFSSGSLKLQMDGESLLEVQPGDIGDSDRSNGTIELWQRKIGNCR